MARNVKFLDLIHWYQKDASDPMSWSDPRQPACLCNFPPCKEKNEHDASRFPAGVSECLKGYLRSKSIPATFSEWSEANPRA